ncbi:MBL fold metallo-hydrolase [Roseibacillus persicicus]|uniref:MBL fold metallo-hydrolase n=1 Tax=Roseibacillus persicicus TaxID=454148 RepID=UPI00398A82CA
MAIIPLEDNFEDVLGKAMRGTGMSREILSSLTEVSEDDIAKLEEGELLEEPLRRIAASLGLDADSLVERAQGSWQPETVEMEGLRQFITPHKDYTVASYLVWDPDSMEAAMFDTGTNVDDAYSLVQALGLNVTQLFLTHTHSDHIKAASKIKRWGKVAAHTLGKEPAPNAERFLEGQEFRIGALKVSTRLTWGHSPASVTYVVEGLDRPVAIVGDAIFAQSMGGGVVSYQAALETNRKEIFTLADDTIICPGHGPMTSVAEEKAHNPFFPELK